ncbi:hypothetical protein [Marinicella rhabdoformis]|uniref:hypothetical protein n=1 Tax=Marinicella rhabdoformis TaxID=2580566 RepID=UPI0012AEB71D|nr:hypothetical protein [Marinicella rhabdoformis]
MKTKTFVLGLLACTFTHAAPSEHTEGEPIASKNWLVLDDVAYLIYEDINIDFSNQEVLALNNDINNCTQFNSDPPFNTGLFTLVTDTQEIGLIGDVSYDLGRKAIILTSQTGDLICDGAFEFDRIYFGDFD